MASELSLALDPSGSGTYNLGGGALLFLSSSLAEFIGERGSGSFTQSGGTHSAGGYLYLGDFSGASGTYSLSGGSLFCGSELVIGNSGAGNFTQSGGTSSAASTLIVGELGTGVFAPLGRSQYRVRQLYLGDLSGSSGTYNLSGSGLLSVSSSAYEYIGHSGSGIFTQSGGTNLAGDNLYLGYTPSGSGTYNLSGGSLSSTERGNDRLLRRRQLRAIRRNEYPEFAHARGGGRRQRRLLLERRLTLIFRQRHRQWRRQRQLQLRRRDAAATPPWSSSIAMTLTSSGGNNTVDTTGGNISLTGILSGSGGLNKAGAGTLSLGGTNVYCGSTSILAGVLLLANSNAVQNSTVNVSVDNGLQFLPGVGTFNLGGLAGATSLRQRHSRFARYAQRRRQCGEHDLQRQHRRQRWAGQGGHGHADPFRIEQLQRRRGRSPPGRWRLPRRPRCPAWERSQSDRTAR